MKTLCYLTKPEVIENIIELMPKVGITNTYTATQVAERYLGFHQARLKKENNDELAVENFRLLTTQVEILLGKSRINSDDLVQVLAEIIHLKSELGSNIFISEGGRSILFLHESQSALRIERRKSICVEPLQTLDQIQARLLILNMQFAIKQYILKNPDHIFKAGSNWQSKMREALRYDIASIEESGLPANSFTTFKKEIESIMSKVEKYPVADVPEYTIAVSTFDETLSLEEILNQIIAIELESEGSSQLLNRKHSHH